MENKIKIISEEDFIKSVASVNIITSKPDLANPFDDQTIITPKEFQNPDNYIPWTNSPSYAETHPDGIRYYLNYHASNADGLDYILHRTKSNFTAGDYRLDFTMTYSSSDWRIRVYENGILSSLQKQPGTGVIGDFSINFTCTSPSANKIQFVRIKSGNWRLSSMTLTKV
jgi:hypothetical protein